MTVQILQPQRTQQRFYPLPQYKQASSNFVFLCYALQASTDEKQFILVFYTSGLEKNPSLSFGDTNFS